jgi:hypothetical protein
MGGKGLIPLLALTYRKKYQQLSSAFPVSSHRNQTKQTSQTSQTNPSKS